MTQRRETFVLVANPDKRDQARDVLTAWLREIDGHDGYLGGAVLEEIGNELLPDTYVLTLDFVSTEAKLAFEPATGPLVPDDKDAEPTDQGAVLFDPQAVSGLRYDHGGGLFAHLLHVHGQLVEEYAAIR